MVSIWVPFPEMARYYILKSIHDAEIERHVGKEGKRKMKGISMFNAQPH